MPISITVLTQETLSNNNISNAKDLAAFTPGLAVNNRYGSDNTVFTIRGFYQEQRSFCDGRRVLRRRRRPARFGRDVRRRRRRTGLAVRPAERSGTQGTAGHAVRPQLTGGAVLLVPQKPKDKTEGYIEGSVGNYNMWRLQGVANFAISDTARMRVGVDHQDRKGYLKNAGSFGDGKFKRPRARRRQLLGGARAAWWSILRPISKTTRFSATPTRKATACRQRSPRRLLPPAIQPACRCFNGANFGCELIAQDGAREAPFGFWSVSNRMPDAQSITDQWQAINTMTWRASDSLTVKHIFSYAEFKGKTNVDLFGNYALLPGVASGPGNLSQVTGFAFTHNEGTFGTHQRPEFDDQRTAISGTSR